MDRVCEMGYEEGAVVSALRESDNDPNEALVLLMQKQQEPPLPVPPSGVVAHIEEEQTGEAKS